MCAKNHNIAVTLKLLSTMALPILTYAIEALGLNKSELISLDHPWLRMFQKVFQTFDNNVVRTCQLYTGYLPMSHYYSMQSMSFLRKLSQSPSLLVRHICETSINDDVSRIANSFKCDSKCFMLSFQSIIRKDFEVSCIVSN
jgi:hypothetical protein